MTEQSTTTEGGSYFDMFDSLWGGSDESSEVDSVTTTQETETTEGGGRPEPGKTTLF